MGTTQLPESDAVPVNSGGKTSLDFGSRADQETTWVECNIKAKIFMKDELILKFLQIKVINGHKTSSNLQVSDSVFNLGL